MAHNKLVAALVFVALTQVHAQDGNANISPNRVALRFVFDSLDRSSPKAHDRELDSIAFRLKLSNAEKKMLDQASLGYSREKGFISSIGEPEFTARVGALVERTAGNFLEGLPQARQKAILLMLSEPLKARSQNK